MKNYRLMGIHENSMEPTKETYEKTSPFSDSFISGMTLVAINVIIQLTHKKTAIPKIIGVAVRNAENTSLLSSYSLPIQISNGWQICSPVEVYYSKDVTVLSPCLLDWPLLYDSTMMCHHTYKYHFQ
jgi:hypothetical protein